MSIRDATVNAAFRGSRALMEWQRDSSRLQMGIEVEFESVDYHYSDEASGMPGWRSVEDGSLRNGGHEFVTPRAWSMSTAITSLRSLYSEADSAGFTTSVRTGTHVHVNMINNTLREVQNVAVAHALVEPGLFSVLGTEREQNIYCIPWYRAGDEAIDIHGSLTSYPDRLVSLNKYTSLFLGPLRTIGTIEFRHAPTFDSAEDAIYWLKIIRQIWRARNIEGVDLVQHLHEEGLKAVYEALGLGYMYNPRVEELTNETLAIEVAETISGYSSGELAPDEGWEALELSDLSDAAVEDKEDISANFRDLSYYIRRLDEDTLFYDEGE